MTATAMSNRMANTLFMTRNKRKKVLLVEDDSTCASMERIMMERMGFDVHVASNGHHAIQLAGDKRFDLCVIDLILPDISGLDVASQLQLAYPETNILLYSGSAVSSSCMSDALEQGFPILPKPIRPGNLSAYASRQVSVN